MNERLKQNNLAYEGIIEEIKSSIADVKKQLKKGKKTI